jgi:hypothetical protein
MTNTLQRHHAAARTIYKCLQYTGVLVTASAHGAARAALTGLFGQPVGWQAVAHRGVRRE